jgi:hypothetical protein
MKKLLIALLLLITASCASIMENKNVWCEHGNQHYRIKNVKQIVVEKRQNKDVSFIYGNVYDNHWFTFSIEGRDGNVIIRDVYIGDFDYFSYDNRSWESDNAQSCEIVNRVLTESNYRK